MSAVDEGKVKEALKKSGSDRLVVELNKAIPKCSVEDAQLLGREFLLQILLELRVKNQSESIIQAEVNAPELEKRLLDEIVRVKKVKEDESKALAAKAKTPVKAATKDPVVKTEVTETKEMTTTELLKFFLDKEERDRKLEKEKEEARLKADREKEEARLKLEREKEEARLKLERERKRTEGRERERRNEIGRRKDRNKKKKKGKNKEPLNLK